MRIQLSLSLITPITVNIFVSAHYTNTLCDCNDGSQHKHHVLFSVLRMNLMINDNMNGETSGSILFVVQCDWFRRNKLFPSVRTAVHSACYPNTHRLPILELVLVFFLSLLDAVATHTHTHTHMRLHTIDILSSCC